MRNRKQTGKGSYEVSAKCMTALVRDKSSGITHLVYNTTHSNQRAYQAYLHQCNYRVLKIWKDDVTESEAQDWLVSNRKLHNNLTTIKGLYEEAWETCLSECLFNHNREVNFQLILSGDRYMKQNLQLRLLESKKAINYGIPELPKYMVEGIKLLETAIENMIILDGKEVSKHGTLSTTTLL